MLIQYNGDSNQVKCLNQTFLNIITNFLPSSTIHTLTNLNGSLEISKSCWVKKKSFIQNIDWMVEKVNVDRIRDECFQPITTSKENYLKSLGNKLIDKATVPKNYWNIINGFLNKCRIPRIPPLFVTPLFITPLIPRFLSLTRSSRMWRLNFLMIIFWINVSPLIMIVPFLVLSRFHPQILLILR